MKLNWIFTLGNCHGCFSDCLKEIYDNCIDNRKIKEERLKTFDS